MTVLQLGKTMPQSDLRSQLSEDEKRRQTLVHNLLIKVREFFFQPISSHTLAAIRMATGAMIAYVHLVWLMRLSDFMGPDAIVSNELWRTIHSGPDSDWKWNYLVLTDSMFFLRAHEFTAVLLGVAVSLGLLTRTSLLLAFLTTLMTTHRLTGFLFGLDQIVLMLCGYLCLGQSGRVMSLDHWLAKRYPAIAFHGAVAWMSGWFGRSDNADLPSWKNQLATRLIQIHLCIIYLFGGLGKLRGEMWWDGSAMWFSAAAYEYQSLDLTWIGRYPVMCALLTHMTVFWEVGYIAIVWPRWLRPITLSIALMVHSGIAIFLGMITFGLMMIIANFAFVPPEVTRRIFLGARRSTERASSGTELQSAPAHR